MKRLDLTPLATDKLAFIEKLLKLPSGDPVRPHLTQIHVLQNIKRTTVLALIARSIRRIAKQQLVVVR